MTEEVKGGGDDVSVAGFRKRNGRGPGRPMSQKFYNELKKAGLGPKESVVLNSVFVFPEDEAAWRTARSNPTGDEAARVRETRARWHRRALAAGKAAAESPKHISKRKLGRSKRPARSK